MPRLKAQMAELVDALVSNTSGFTPRIFPTRAKKCSRKTLFPLAKHGKYTTFEKNKAY